ncbi:Permuted papain-like amidase enzyme, YaeF/YiiX, C92 family [Chryseobacterium arachidis]|uniref:Permuted papain-like amidase enzyme, YaeF/YiiX, C92 family n=2 Tax=Chryseobacterium arachidis TaxID=1416778 RepID=A0A1M4ZDA0_9FLAO|nr:YiiX/YebB-like N1pC/P60 family cysteine hydrolase [Chryseobacterium arachidis]SHF16033.1 Permuted papain-like amidase enzyme, YaeF/YiiX, C92 family [Chryseobacterium arachidis]
MKPILKRNNFLLNFFAVIFLLNSILSCGNSQISGVRNGDLLFVTAKETGLSGAINNVTQTQKNVSFDHIGILEQTKKGTFVLHAAPKGGSQKQNIVDFLKDQRNDGQKIIVYRLKSQYQNTIPNAIENANSMLGKSYNFNYILDENSYYCSDFVERAFRKDNIFKLEPMTFIDPKTGKTNTFWEEFYQKKNLKVPEGELGCNPNGLAASDKIERVKELK